MTKNTKITSIYLGIAFLVLILTLAFSAYLMKDTGKKIQNNLGYAIGIYNSEVGGGRHLRIDTYIDFKVNGKLYKRMAIQGKAVNKKKATIGDKYLAIYDTLNPKNCQILFDYPIKDSTDFKQYLEEFKTKPLDFDKYF